MSGLPQCEVLSRRAEPKQQERPDQKIDRLENGDAEVSWSCQDKAILSLAEEIMVSRFCERLHSRMPHSSLNGNRIESFPNCIEPADGLCVVLSARLLFHRRRCREEPHSRLAEHFQ